jgi:hypothetical protein
MNDQQGGDTPCRLLMRYHNMVAYELICLGAHSLIKLVSMLDQPGAPGSNFVHKLTLNL